MSFLFGVLFTWFVIGIVIIFGDALDWGISVADERIGIAITLPAFIICYIIFKIVDLIKDYTEVE